MQDDSTSTLEELLRGQQEGLVVVTPDLAAFVLLVVAEQLGDDARYGGALLSVDGTVAAVTARRSRDVMSPVTALAALLRKFLAGAGVPAPTLLALTEVPEACTTQEWAKSLAKALMPLNRDASKRALGRMVRELKRNQGTHGLRAIPLGDGTVTERLSLTPPPPLVEPIEPFVERRAPKPEGEAASERRERRSKEDPVSARMRTLLGEYDKATDDEVRDSLRAIAGVDVPAPISAPPVTPALVMDRVSYSRASTAAKVVVGLVLLGLGLLWALWPGGH